MIKVIGLTGGIGSGKSTVSGYLKSKGIRVVDCDELSAELTKKGGKALEDIKNAFGPSVFTQDGELNRNALSEIVFHDKSKLEILERITTDKVVSRVKKTVEKIKESSSHGVIVIDAPLLFECGLEKMCDETWLVICDREIKIKRVILRGNLSREQIAARINNQMSDKEKILSADIVIDNSYDFDSLYKKIDELIEERIDN